ncbi:MAG: hypothetical protein IPH28_08375 [Cytophagaceae bacterium]|nr:hypothetical protein [Cytophagaceae bacterium]
MKILKLTMLLLLPFLAQSQKDFKVVAYCTHGTDVSSIPFNILLTSIIRSEFLPNWGTPKPNSG